MRESESDSEQTREREQSRDDINVGGIEHEEVLDMGVRLEEVDAAVGGGAVVGRARV